MAAPAVNPQSTYEIHYFPTSEKLTSPNVDSWSPLKIQQWPERLQKARSSTYLDISEIDFDTLISPPTHANNLIVLDFHNVFDTDISTFVQQCSLWNSSGHQVHICSFVGKGTDTHASLLATFDNPAIQKVIKSLIIVFDRQHPKKGKGHMIQHLLLNQNVSVTFVDDELKNLENCYKLVNRDRVKYIHYVAVPQVRQRSTPGYAKSITNFPDLVLSLKNP